MSPRMNGGDAMIRTALIALSIAVAAMQAGAQRQPASALAQAAWGTRFDDAVYGLNTADGRMSTILLDATVPGHFGENTFFIRLFSGEFVGSSGAPTGARTVMYAEWTSRFSLLPRARRESGAGLLRDVFLAGQLNRGSTGFRANLAGLGVRVAGPGGSGAKSTVYYRRADGDAHGIKWRTSWWLPFRVGPLPVTFDGSADLVTRTSAGTDFNAMPDLVADVGPLAGLPAGTLGIGGEWFVHHARGARLSAPELVLRWNF